MGSQSPTSTPRRTDFAVATFDREQFVGTVAGQRGKSQLEFVMHSGAEQKAAVVRRSRPGVGVAVANITEAGAN